MYDKQQFLLNTKKCLDSAVYGHDNAKQHILQVISKWITNDKSGGNILALQGPMGNGKTTLVKDGISNQLIDLLLYSTWWNIRCFLF